MHTRNSNRPPHHLAAQRFLIFGRTGWIGGLLGEELTRQGAHFEYASARLEDRSAVEAELERVRWCVVCCVQQLKQCQRRATQQLQQHRHHHSLSTHATRPHNHLTRCMMCLMNAAPSTRHAAFLVRTACKHNRSSRRMCSTQLV